MAGVWELRRMPSGGGLLDWCWTAICVTRHGIMILVDVINSDHPCTAGPGSHGPHSFKSYDYLSLLCNS